MVEVGVNLMGGVAMVKRVWEDWRVRIGRFMVRVRVGWMGVSLYLRSTCVLIKLWSSKSRRQAHDGEAENCELIPVYGSWRGQERCSC